MYYSENNNNNLNINIDEGFSPGFQRQSCTPQPVRPTPEYLQELLKDKRSLQSFPNIFHHMNNLIEYEINRVRGQLFHVSGPTKTNGMPLDLPDPEGPVITHQEKVFIPVKENPNYNFVGRLLGPRGMTAKQLETELGCKIMVRGKGSMRDKKKEELNNGKPNWEHLTEELHVLVVVEDTENRAALKAHRAAEEIKTFLENAVRTPEGEDKLKQMQLMELAMLNEANKQTLLPVGTAAGTTFAQIQQLLRLPTQAAAGSPIMLAAAAPRMANGASLLNAAAAVNAAAGAAGGPPPLVSPGDPSMAMAALGYPTMSQADYAYFLNSTPALFGMAATGIDHHAAAAAAAAAAAFDFSAMTHMAGGPMKARVANAQQLRASVHPYSFK